MMVLMNSAANMEIVNSNNIFGELGLELEEPEEEDDSQDDDSRDNKLPEKVMGSGKGVHRGLRRMDSFRSDQESVDPREDVVTPEAAVSKNDSKIQRSSSAALLEEKKGEIVGEVAVGLQRVLMRRRAKSFQRMQDATKSEATASQLRRLVPKTGLFQGLGRSKSRKKDKVANNVTPLAVPEQAAHTKRLQPTISKGCLKMPSNKSTGRLKRNGISFGSTSTFEFDAPAEDPKNASWYSIDEMRDIRQSLVRDVRNGDITRGLEEYAQGNLAGCRGQRLDHQAAVLRLQKAQRARGIQDNWQSLGKLSRSNSIDHLSKARQLASFDSEQAYQEHLALAEETTCELTRSSSRTALLNFRKTMSTTAVVHRPKTPNMTAAWQPTSHQNATFGRIHRPKARRIAPTTTGKPPNMLLQAMAKRHQQEAALAVHTQAS